MYPNVLDTGARSRVICPQTSFLFGHQPVSIDPYFFLGFAKLGLKTLSFLLLCSFKSSCGVPKVGGLRARYPPAFSVCWRREAIVATKIIFSPDWFTTCKERLFLMIRFGGESKCNLSDYPVEQITV